MIGADVETPGWRLARKITPSQAHAIATAMLTGADAQALADAYGVSKRTIYRYARYGRTRWARVVVGEWAAEYVITEYGPIRCTPWVAS